MTSVKRASELGASTESPLKKPRDSLDTVEPSVDLEGPDDFEKAFKRWRQPNSPSRSVQDDDSTTPDLSNRLAPLSLPTTAAVCFGMIHNANTKFIETDDSSVEDSEGVPSISMFGQLKVSFEERAVFLGFSAERNIAVLNEETAKVLRHLSSFDSFRIQAFLGEGSSLLIRGKRKDTGKDRFMPVDIVIYGSPEIRKSVGGLLSAARIYLQHPCHQDPNTVYDNPHFLNLTDLYTMSILPRSTSGNQTPLNTFETPITSLGKPSEGMKIADTLQSKLSKVFNSLTRYKTLKRLEADIKITTPLLPHQEQALDFMAQREMGPIPTEFSLWSKHENGNGSCYEHDITGSRTAEAPLETLGGILADDMGLGKTLTVLSTILRTAQMSKSYAEENNENIAAAKGNAIGNNEVFSRATLVIVPSSLLINGWLEEIKAHCDGSLNIHVYHGRSREIDAETLADWDLVLTTYHTVAAEALQPLPPLNQITWFRIVLDEAHIIRRITTKLFQAVSRLSSKFRWCLTGTPIQNSLEDLASLVAFIQISPLDTLTEFRKHIITPLLKGRGQGSNSLRLLLDSICLRRTKKLLNLPESFDEDRRIDFTSPETKFYKEIQAKLIATVKQHESQARNKKDFFGMFQLQLQLRRVCNHGTFQKTQSTALAEDIQFDPEQAFELLHEKKMVKCTYCNVAVRGVKWTEDDRGGSFSVCGHLFCSECVPKYEAALRSAPGAGHQCPICLRKVSENCILGRGPHTERPRSVLPSILVSFDDNSISSKVMALINDLKANDDEGKSIVFSCWTRSLDLVAQHLAQQQILYARIDGTYSLSQRQKILNDYHTNTATRILLMTTGTGAVGLNLTVANCVYILEPQWNPMVENQAIGRVLRLGQKRNVKVVRYIINGTVEEGMRSQQARKLGFAKLGWRTSE